MKEQLDEILESLNSLKARAELFEEESIKNSCVPNSRFAAGEVFAFKICIGMLEKLCASDGI
jgi:hypothetical protein